MVEIRCVGYLAEPVGKREVVAELRHPKPAKSSVDAGIDPEDAIVLVNGRPARGLRALRLGGGRGSGAPGGERRLAI